MNRRQFISYSGVGFAAVTGLSMIDPLMQLHVMSRGKLRNSVKEMQDDISYLLYMASLAPSGHNVQPWTVRIIDKDHWMLGTDDTRWLPVVDPQNRETLISIGAFLENLIVAAGVKGYEVEVEVVAKSTKDKEVLQIKLHKIGRPISFDVKKIELRRTVRNYFLKEKLSKEDIDFLTGENSDSVFYWARESEEGKYLTEKTLLANRLQTYHNAAQEELAKWIRWSKRDSLHYRSGLTPETMEIEGVAKWYVENFYSNKSALTPGFREETIKRVQEQVAAGSGWLLITSKDSSIPELIDTGRKLQRMWLKVRDREIAIHPMNQMLEEESLRDEIAPALGTTDKAQILLRIGYIRDYPQPVSPRMPLANIILG